MVQLYAIVPAIGVIASRLPQIVSRGTRYGYNGNDTLDGYMALAELDTNKDGVIDSIDEAWDNLRVWLDNGDGVSRKDEREIAFWQDSAKLCCLNCLFGR